LARSVEADPLVAAPANVCLYRIASSSPWGFGRTLAALLEAGTLHESSAVVAQCSTTVDQMVDSMPETITWDIDGRITLLLSALCLWAHGDSADVKQAAKVIMFKLGSKFSGQPEWDEAVQDTESVLIDMWNRGLDPSPEEEQELEREQEERKKREDVFAKLEEHENIATSPRAAAARTRGWLVPAGQRRYRCDSEATMYPQVFAALGFRGAGGPAVGLHQQSAFDSCGAYRRRETVTETKRVEFARVLANGKVQVWEELEETVRQSTHLESCAGEFARRETVRVRHEEVIGGKVVNKEKNKQDFVHLRNLVGEFSTYVDCKSPTSPLIASPHAREAFNGQTAEQAVAEVAIKSQQVPASDDGTLPYIVEEPPSP